MYRPGNVAGTAVAVLLVGASLALAGGKSETIGSDLGGSPNASFGYGCGDEAPCAILQLKIENRKVQVPFSGRVKRWRFRTIDPDHSAYEVRLRVVRKVSSNRFRFRGRSKPGLIPANATGTFVFKTDMRAKKGDLLALELPPDQLGIQGFYVAGDARSLAFFGLPDGGRSTEKPEQEVLDDDEYLYNATVKRRR